MAMGKNSRSPLAQMVGPAVMDKMPDQPPEMTIKQSGNGGYIVRMQGKSGYSSQKEHVYATLDDVMECAEKHFGKAEASEAGEKIADAIVQMNGASLDDLYHLAVQARYPYDREHFGYHLGMQAVGHGVSYSDDCDLRHDAIKIPRDEF